MLCPVTGMAARRGHVASARQGLRIQVAWAKNASELAAAKVNHARGQPATLVNPAPDLEWIHRIQCLRCLEVGYFATSGIGIPGCMESEPSTGSHAYPVMRNRTENDGAGRNTRTVDNHPLARTAHALIFAAIDFDPATASLRNPNLPFPCPTPPD